MHQRSYAFVKKTEEIMDRGIPFHEAWKKAMRECKVAQATARSWIAKGEFEYHGVDTSGKNKKKLQAAAIA